MNNFFSKKLLYLILTYTGIAFAVGSPEAPNGKQMPGSGPQQNFQISDDELKALNLDPKEAEELKQFFDALNNLTPSQKQELEELGRATEERMRQQNLDPNNMDDLMKFLETQSPPQEEPSEQKLPKKEDRPLPARPLPAPPATYKMEKPEIVAVTSPTDTLTMINELSNYLASLEQKAITIPAMVKKLDAKAQEIAELKVYLGMLRAPDLIKLLSSKDFVRLQNSLDQLHTSLKTFEPSISAKKHAEIIHFNNPYEVLDLPYNATDQEIKARYEELSAHQSPQTIEKRVRDEGCEEKICKKKIKSAQRAFKLIEDAYTSLSKNREATDEHLTTQMAKEARKEVASMRSFDNLFAAMTIAFTSDKILQQIHQLLEKYKPEQLAQMKSQVELEKKVYERSKKRITIPQARPSQRPQGSPYESFYKKVGQQQKHPLAHKRGHAGDMPTGNRKEKLDAEKAGAALPGEKGKKEEAKKDEKKEAGKESKEKKEEPKKSTEPTKEDIEKLAEIGSLGKLFEKAKKQKEIEVTLKQRAGAEPITSTQKLPQIMSRLEDELRSDDTDNQEAAQHLKEYFTKIDLGGIEKALKTVAPGQGKKLSGMPAKLWADNVAKYKDLVKDWYTTVAQPLDIGERNNNKKRFREPISLAKIRQHGIEPSNIDPWLKLKSGEEPPARKVKEGNVDLGKIRSSINAIRTYIKETGTN